MRRYLKFIGFFSGFTDQELDNFGLAANVIRTKKNDFIIKENEPGNGIFFIADGEFIAVKDIKEKKYKRLQVLKSGEFFGEMSFLTNEKNSASIISDGAGILIHLSKEAFEDLATNDTALSYAIIKKIAVILAERLQHMNLKYSLAVGQLQSK